MKVGDLVMLNVRQCPDQWGLIIERKSLAIGFPRVNFVKFFNGHTAIHSDDVLEIINESR